jgi:hypothetical protein
MSDRLREKQDLLVKLGVLFGPLLRLIEHPHEYDAQEKAEAIARYCAEFEILIREFKEFTQGQAGHDYAVQAIGFHIALTNVRSDMVNRLSLETSVRRNFAAARDAIDAVPIPSTSVIVEAGSPFTAYRKLRELCEVDATNSLTWLDPYLDASVFHRYLSDVRPAVKVTLVSAEPSANDGRRGQLRWEALLDASHLFAQERGNAVYRLVNQPELHDRWVIFDGKRIYALGGSPKDAAAKDYFTIASVEGTPENLIRIQQHIERGRELFGSVSPTHQ